jgi:hypothetical protein
MVAALKFAVSLACTLGLLAILWSGWSIARGLYLANHVETDPQEYDALIGKWTSSGLVSHFPKPLPATATKTELSAYPGFLQGGAWFQVRLTLPPVDVEAIYEAASKLAKDFYDGGDIFSAVNSKEHGLAGTSFHTTDLAHNVEFPPDYRIFVFGAQNRGNWNHGESYGVVVSKKRNEVIYFAEDW